MTVLDLATILTEGLAAHQVGKLDLAEARYREVLRAVPQQPDALHLLGVVALQQGHLEEADRSVRAALALAPQQTNYWNSLVAIQVARGDLAAEAEALARLTDLVPTNARAWGRRGVLAYQAGRMAEAADLLARSASLAPDDADAWSNLGIVYLALGRLTDAEASLRRALAVRPDFPAALNNLGGVLVALSRWTEAAEILARAVTAAPDEANGWVNLGHALKGLERHAEAVAAFERGLALQPDLAVALVGLGDALQGVGQVERAIGCYERALALGLADADTYEHYGIGLQRLGRLDAAAAAFRRCLALDPDRPAAHSGLIVVLDLLEGAEEEARQERRRWNARFGHPSPPAPHSNSPDPERRLRVGYVSADFRHHSAAYAVLPVLRSHDRARIRVVCYSGVTAPDGITDEIRALADIWHDTADLSDDELEALIREDRIDVLVDLSGHSGGNRLAVFAREPAPVQVTAWGYAAGTGLDAMHYFLADPVTVPPEARAIYAEEVVDLPSVIAYTPPLIVPALVPLPALERGSVTFGAFNRLPKVSDEAVAAWGRVLAALPTSRLHIKSGGTEGASVQEWLLRGLAAHGVGPERVTFQGSTPHPDHLAAHNEVDLMLDTFPQSGGITSLDALLMGVPVVTLLGQRVPGRVSASFLTTLGLPDLITRTSAEYVEVAVRAASDLDRLAQERATLRDRLLASPIGDAGVYTRAVEDVYRTLWRRWRSKVTS
jgi:protein O-GlcNAc transferase